MQVPTTGFRTASGFAPDPDIQPRSRQMIVPRTAAAPDFHTVHQFDMVFNSSPDVHYLYFYGLGVGASRKPVPPFMPSVDEIPTSKERLSNVVL